MDDINKYANEEDRVREYLLKNPDFFIKNPEMLTQVNFSHGLHNATSILERQVALLRSHHQTLRERMANLVANAQENEKLLERIQSLTVKLLEQPNAQGVVETLYRSLLDEFGLDHMLLVLSDDISTQPLPYTRYMDSAQFKKMSSAIYNVKVFLGRTPGKIKQHLLDGGNPRAQSVALIRVKVNSKSGYLLVGSSDDNHFHSEQSTDFTNYIGTIVSALLERHLVAQ